MNIQNTLIVALLIITALYLLIGFGLSFLASGPQGGRIRGWKARAKYALIWGRFILAMVRGGR